MQAVELIRRKRDGHSLTADEIRWFISEYMQDCIPDYQMSAWLMAITQVPYLMHPHVPVIQ